jgi:hypothetical protein
MNSHLSLLLPWAPLIGPALAALVAIVGFGISHWLTSKRDQVAEKRKIRINFMIEAYRKIESGSSRGPNAGKYTEQFQSALADIQLLGSTEQAELARRIASALGEGSGSSVKLNELLNALRSELRRELNLPEVGSELVLLRSLDDLRNNEEWLQRRARPTTPQKALTSNDQA